MYSAFGALMSVLPASSAKLDLCVQGSVWLVLVASCCCTGPAETFHLQSLPVVASCDEQVMGFAVGWWHAWFVVLQVLM